MPEYCLFQIERKCIFGMCLTQINSGLAKQNCPLGLPGGQFLLSEFHLFGFPEIFYGTNF